MNPEIERSPRETQLENALNELLDLFEFTSPVAIEAYVNGELVWCELTEEAEGVVQRAEMVLGWEEDEQINSSL